MTTDLNTLLTALYVKIDDWLGRPRRTGRPPRLSDAELLTMAVAQALLGIRSEARWLRFLPTHLPGAFPYLPGQSGYNKRLRAALPLLKRAIRAVAADTDLWTDNVWVTDSTPVECGRSRPTAKRSDLAGWAGYSYCASHSRWFWGLRLHLICTPAGLPITWALANPKIDDRQVLTAVLDDDPDLLTERPGLLIIADKVTCPPNSTGGSPTAGSGCCGPHTATAPHTRTNTYSNRSGSSSSRSTTPSKANLTSNYTADAASKASAPA